MKKSQLLTRSLLGLMLLLSTLCLYVPQLIYFANINDFSLAFTTLISRPLLLGLGVMGTLVLLLSLLPAKILKYFSALLLALSILAWFQGDILRGQYGLLDGTALNTGNAQQLFGLLAPVVFLVIAMVFNQASNKHLPWVAGLILAAQLVLTTYVVLNHPTNAPSHNQKDDQEFFNYSSQQNVIVVVLDTFGSQIFQQIQQQEPDLINRFNGFVSYPDTTSNYPATLASIPSMLSGKMLPTDKPFNQFLQQDVAAEGLLATMERRGYEVSFSTVLATFSDIYSKRFLFEPSFSPSALQSFHSARLFDYALFRVVPDNIKPGIYNQGKWFTSNFFAEQLTLPSTHSEKGMFVFDMNIERAQVVNSKKRFKFIHLNLPHPEFVYDALCNYSGTPDSVSKPELMYRQSVCALRKLDELFSVYRQLNIYDNSLIVVTSDHGARLLSDMSYTGFPSFFELNASGVLFMVKGIGQTAPFQQNLTPYTLLGLFDLILDEEKYHSDYNHLSAENRPFYSYRNNHKGAPGYLPDAPYYQVEKDHSNPASWQLQQFININCPAESLPLLIRFNTNKRTNYCSKHGFARPDRKKQGTWTRSIDTRILFHPDMNSIAAEQTYQIKLKFEPQIDHTQPAFMLSLSLNGSLIEQTTINSDATQELTVLVPGSSFRSGGVNELKLLMPELRSARERGINQDSRKLGLFLYEVAIMEAEINQP